MNPARYAILMLFVACGDENKECGTPTRMPADEEVVAVFREVFKPKKARITQISTPQLWKYSNDSTAGYWIDVTLEDIETHSFFLRFRYSKIEAKWVSYGLADSIRWEYIELAPERRRLRHLLPSIEEDTL